jgi:hypothetical protein
MSVSPGRVCGWGWGASSMGGTAIPIQLPLTGEHSNQLPYSARVPAALRVWGGFCIIELLIQEVCSARLKSSSGVCTLVKHFCSALLSGWCVFPVGRVWLFKMLGANHFSDWA